MPISGMTKTLLLTWVGHATNMLPLVTNDIGRGCGHKDATPLI
jgi:hypothetical protein